jgi:Ni/Co efflux regulator RcnB
MKTKITTAIAALLLAGTSTAALAQDHDRDHGGRGQGQAQPQAQAQAQPQAQPQPQQRGPAPGAAPQGHWDGGGRGGGHEGPRGEGFRGEGVRGEGQRGPGAGFERRNFQGQAPVAGAPTPQRFQRGPDAAPSPGPGFAPGRTFDHQRGPHEVVPPGAERGQFDRRDGRVVGGPIDRRDGRGDGRWDGRGDGRGDNRWAGGRGDGRDGRDHWGRGEHWQAGRFPPVFWAQQRFHVGGYRAPYGFFVRSWGFGDILPRGWYGPDYFIDDFIDYDLPYPPPGYEWVRVGGDALMIDRFTGRIVQVVRGIFW